jgi:hypothetical protein
MDAFFRFSDERFLIHHAVNWIPGAEYLLGKGKWRETLKSQGIVRKQPTITRVENLL